MIRYEQSLLSETSIPALWTITQGGEAELGLVVSWFVEHQELLREACYAHGGVVVRGFRAIDSAKNFAAVLDRCAPHLFVERALPRHRVENRTRPWCDVFETEDRTQVQAIAAEKGWACRFRADDSLLLRQRVTTMRTHPKTGARVWANQFHYHMPEGMLAWALRDGRADDAAYYKQMMATAPEDMDHVFHSDGTPVSSSEVEHVWDVLRECEVPVVWQRGDLMLLVIEHEIQPFRVDPVEKKGKTNEMFLHRLPWPSDVLENLLAVRRAGECLARWARDASPPSL